MNFQSAIKSVLSKYATFSGRASRGEYWWWVLALVLLNIALQIVDGAVVAPLLGFEAFDDDAGNPLGMLGALLLLLPNLAVSVRRLHDTDRNGWWILLGMIPLVGTLVLLFFFIQPGTDSENRFGDRPS